MEKQAESICAGAQTKRSSNSTVWRNAPPVKCSSGYNTAAFQATSVDLPCRGQGWFRRDPRAPHELRSRHARLNSGEQQNLPSSSRASTLTLSHPHPSPCPQKLRSIQRRAEHLPTKTLDEKSFFSTPPSAMREKNGSRIALNTNVHVRCEQNPWPHQLNHPTGVLSFCFSRRRIPIRDLLPPSSIELQLEAGHRNEHVRWPFPYPRSTRHVTKPSVSNEHNHTTLCFLSLEKH